MGAHTLAASIHPQFPRSFPHGPSAAFQQHSKKPDAASREVHLREACWPPFLSYQEGLGASSSRAARFSPSTEQQSPAALGQNSAAPPPSAAAAQQAGGLFSGGKCSPISSFGQLASPCSLVRPPSLPLSRPRSRPDCTRPHGHASSSPELGKGEAGVTPPLQWETFHKHISSLLIA